MAMVPTKTGLLASIIIVLLVGAQARSQQAQPAGITSAPDADRAADPAVIKEGRSIFNRTCAHCHGPDAITGLSERNLRHLRARYGSDMHEVFQVTVTKGRPDKGMPVWGEVLEPRTIDEIYSYLETIQEDAD